MAAQDYVILVDEKDVPLGQMEKMQAHREGLLHRAFSVFVFDSANRLLLQKRAEGKYHSAGLWSNTCCGHPRPGEHTLQAARRRLMEEMGLDCPLEEKFSFVYKSHLDDSMIEHEVDHVFFAVCNAEPLPNPEEAEDWKYEELETVARQIRENPDWFTEWFKLVFAEVAALRKSFS
jgi:isopentenyl-diphosphate Delta-isomerase